MFKNKKRLGDLLVESGLIAPPQLEKALAVQKKTGERLGRILANLGYVTEENIIEVLEFQLGVPHVDLAQIQIDPAVAALIPEAMAQRYQVIPIKKEGRRLTLAMVDPTNFYAVDDVRLAADCDVVPVIAAEKEIMRAIRETYGVRELVEEAAARLTPTETPAEVEISEDAPAVNIINALIRQAVKEQASDIHVEPQERRLRVRFRVDGVLREAAVFPRQVHNVLLSRIKVMSGMNIAEKRLPQDGRAKVTAAGRDIDLRISTLPTILGEKAVIRLLDRQAAVLDLSALGFSSDNLALYRRLIRQAYGMVLVTGPTGSGKTTTLYATLQAINALSRNIVTVEDPVEYRLEGINQVQVNTRAGLTFANGLRSILRQDPNVIMVGEIRDGETAEIAIRAALTGHLVLSTMHTNDAAGAATRLIDMGIAPFLVASSLLGVVAQRLVRMVCRECRQSYEAPPDAALRSFIGATPSDRLTLFRGAGCPRCGHTGYKGRMAIQEVLPMSSRLRVALTDRAGSDALGRLAREEGFTTMQEDGLYKARQGLTTVDEVMRVTYTL